MKISWGEFKYLWHSDLYRYYGRVNLKVFLHSLQVSAGFRYSFLMRLGTYLNGKRSNILGRIIYRLFYEIFRHYQFKYGISIPTTTEIGRGFYIGHFGGIIINEEVIIGINCNISQNCTIGQTNRGKRKGCPVIGDNVFIGPGAVVIGKILVGNNVAIGANTVVIEDVPDNAVIAGNPGRIISYGGSTGYINRTDY